MYYVVTGAAGFIGSNLVKALNERGETDIIAVDNLTRADKFRNLAACEIADFIDKRDFVAQLTAGEFEGAIEALLHQGACSDTMETDGRYMMENNYRYSVALLDYCQEEEVPLLYASSASVYGAGSVFRESRECEAPLNIYGYSKFLFDEYVRNILYKAGSQVVGLRYFNVYGPREQHKASMASVACHLNQQILSDGKVRLFEGSDGYADGEQRRDFIYVEDVVAVNLWLQAHSRVSGIFNVGTGNSCSFNEVARAVINWHGRGVIEYIPFPEQLAGSYQSFTEADITALRQLGYEGAFTSIDDGVRAYLDWLNQSCNE